MASVIAPPQWIIIHAQTLPVFAGLQLHPKAPGLVVRPLDGERVLEQMIWGLPLVQKSKQTGALLKPKLLNNARPDRLASPFWKRWAMDPHNRCLISTARYAEAVGP